MKNIRVNLGAGYDVLAGSGLLKAAGERIRSVLPSAGRLVIVTTPRVGRLWSKPLLRSLRTAKIPFSISVVPDGEIAKSLSLVARLMDEFAARSLDRSSAVIALGGGAVGDLAGFAASLYMRGIPVVQVPTTLLAQVDASIGGKTGVNLRAGKNLVGTFHQPALVLADTETLTTLPERTFRAGLFEAIKCGVIRDASLFHLLRDRNATILSREEGMLEEIISAAVQVKADVVAADERESGLRRILNFGHTIGHAIEASGGYHRHSHGEAVGLGMMAAAEIGCATGVTPRAVTDEIREVIKSYGPLPQVKAAPRELMRYIASDKKTIAGVPHFVLPTRIGEVIITGKVTRAQIAAGIRSLA